jgi:hypothetical protein
MKVQSDLRVNLFFTRRLLFSTGDQDLNLLKQLKDEIVSEEGPEFAEWLVGPVCSDLRNKKEAERDD